MKFNELLEIIGSPFSEHEVQGYMVGLLIQNLKEAYHTELQLYLRYDADMTDVTSNINQHTVSLLKMLTDKSLKNSYKNEQAIDEKILALSDWTKHLYMSLSLGVEKKYIPNDMEIQEAMHNFDEIGKINEKYNLNDMENNDKHYNNIREYVEKTVLRLFVKIREK